MNTLKRDQRGSTVDQINADIRRLHAQRPKTYRPTAVAVIEDHRGKLLFVQSKRSWRWGFLQGGVKKGEGIVEGLEREMNEEAGIQSWQIILPYTHFFIDTVDTHGRKRDGFQLGVTYYYTYAKCDGPLPIHPRARENRDYQWLTWHQAVAFIRRFNVNDGYGQKKASLLRALRHLQHIQNK